MMRSNFFLREIKKVVMMKQKKLYTTPRVFALLLLKIIRCDTHSHTIRYTLRSYSIRMLYSISIGQHISIVEAETNTSMCSVCLPMPVSASLCVCVCMVSAFVFHFAVGAGLSTRSQTSVMYLRALVCICWNTEPTNEELNVCICNTAACTTSERR